MNIQHHRHSEYHHHRHSEYHHHRHINITGIAIPYSRFKCLILVIFLDPVPIYNMSMLIVVFIENNVELTLRGLRSRKQRENRNAEARSQFANQSVVQIPVAS